MVTVHATARGSSHELHMASLCLDDGAVTKVEGSHGRHTPDLIRNDQRLSPRPRGQETWDERNAPSSRDDAKRSDNDRDIDRDNDRDNDEATTDLLTLYQWLDALPLPSIKRSSGIVARDFSDATAIADIVHYYFPSYVEQHNYVKTSNTVRKKANWEVLMTKVLLKRKEFRGVFAPAYGRQHERDKAIAGLCAGVTGGDGRNAELEAFLWRLMGCCRGGGAVDYAVGSMVGARTKTMSTETGAKTSAKTMGGSVARRERTGANGRSGSAGSEGSTAISELSSEASEASTTETSMIQALMEENAKLSTMVIKQDGIIRLMQAKIEALEQRLCD